VTSEYFRQQSPFESSSFQAGLDGKIAETRMLLEVVLRAKLVLENFGQIPHVFTWWRLHNTTNANT